MRLAFLGTPEPALPSLRALVDGGHDVAIVITRPDARRGRGGEPSASPVKTLALELGLQVAHHARDIEGLDVERGVVVAYGSLIRADLLERTPMLNVHFSLLPRWRGAAPVERAILAGDDSTGVSVMSLEATLDTGPVHLVRRLEVGEKRASELSAELAELGADALLEVLASPQLLAHPQAQRGEATYAEKLTSETYHLVPAMSEVVMLRTVRLERAFTYIDGRRLRVVRAHARASNDASFAAAGSLRHVDGAVVLVGEDGAIGLDDVQPEGARVMTAAAWWAGARLDVATTRWS
jgi:methionyl-tRNA formyltransferase